MWNWVHTHHDDLIALGPIATIFAAVIAVIVTGLLGYAQWRIARAQKDIALDKLKLDLFERRFAVYQAAMSLAITLRPNSIKRIEYEIFSDCQAKLSEARFLFSPKVSELSEKISGLAFDWEQEGELLNRNHLSAMDLELVSAKRQQIPNKMAELYFEIAPTFWPELSYRQLTRKPPSERGGLNLRHSIWRYRLRRTLRRAARLKKEGGNSASSQ